MNDTITRNELEIHLKGMEDRITFNEHVTDVRISAMKEMLTQHTENMKAIVEKNLAEHRAIANEIHAEVSDLRADFNDLRGDVKALSVKVDSIQLKFGWYLTLFAIGVSVLIFLAQKIFN